MVKIIFCLRPQDVRWLRARAKRLGISHSELLRRILDEAQHQLNDETLKALKESRRAVQGS